MQNIQSNVPCKIYYCRRNHVAGFLEAMKPFPGFSFPVCIRFKIEKFHVGLA